VLENVTLNSVKVYADGTANRTIYIQDDNGNTIHSQTFNIPDGESTVSLNWAMTPGTDYRFRVAEQNHGLWRDNNSSEVNFPYDIADVVSIVGANTSSSQYYYYFYDWEVEEEAIQCFSELKEVVVMVGIVGVEEGELTSASMYPNPTSGVLNISIPSSVDGNVELRLMDVAGSLVESHVVTAGINSLDLSSISKGVYLVQLTSQNGTYSQRVIVE